jgi:hypothetical protein
MSKLLVVDQVGQVEVKVPERVLLGYGKLLRHCLVFDLGVLMQGIMKEARIPWEMRG